MKVTLDFPDEAKEAVLAGEAWEGACLVTVVPPKATKTRKAAPLPKLTSDEQKIVDAWNKHPYLEVAAKESRNNKISDYMCKKNKPVLEKALEVMGIDELLFHVQTYLTACENQEHIHQGKNKGYDNILGLVKRLLVQAKDGKTIWWQREIARAFDDPNPELTKYIADRYASVYLSRDTFGLVNPSPEYKKFMQASANITKVLTKTSMNKRRLCDYLFACMKHNYDTIIPGHLGSDNTWKILLPKYIKENN